MNWKHTLIIVVSILLIGMFLGYLISYNAKETRSLQQQIIDAERKAIDLACLFAFCDIRRMQGGVSYNIAIYDELFDSSFDSKGIDLIVDIINERIDSYNECAFIISHRKESLKAITGDTIFLEKRNGITTRVDICEM